MARTVVSGALDHPGSPQRGSRWGSSRLSREYNQLQVRREMSSHRTVATEVGEILVADVDQARIAALLEPDRTKLGEFIRKEP